MTSSTVHTTRLSSKGQIILPSVIRQTKRWQAGVKFSVELVDEGILLKPVATGPASTLDEVAGCLNYVGKGKSLTEMDAAITAELKARYVRR
jgi:AbrB family looped-hinge helix DNA binding protein